jgi:uncharacterized protein (TIGR02284 family)
MESSSLVTVLNDLVETSRDGERGFRACAEAVESPELRRLFQDMARSCTEAIGELEREVRAAGGNPAEGGSTAGAMHRGWVNVKSMIMGRDETAVFAECERGEDIAKRSYEEALRANLPEEVRRMVERQYEGLKRNHDRVRDLRDEAAARSRRSKSRAGSSVRGAGSNVAEAGLDYARTVRDSAGSAADYAVRAARDVAGSADIEGAARSIGHRVEQQPIAAAVIAFAVGYALAYLIHGERR